MEWLPRPYDLDDTRSENASGFIPLEPLSRTYSPTLMPASPLSHNNYAFERDFCTNFTCCGQSLADLHLLVDHFEEAHVLVLDADGRPTYPSPAAFYRPIADDYRDYCPDSYPPSPSISNTTSSDTSDSPCSTSFVFDYPHASSEDRDPIRYGCENSGLFGPSVDEEVLTLSTVEFDFDSRKSQLWESLDDDNNILLDYTSCGTYSDVDGVHEADDDTRLPVQEDFRQGHDISEEHLPATAIAAATSKKKVPLAKLSTPSRWRRGAREKLKCPHAGCTKTYLNSNGLKYHIERGTCEIESRGGKQCAFLVISVSCTRQLTYS